MMLQYSLSMQASGSLLVACPLPGRGAPGYAAGCPVPCLLALHTLAIQIDIHCMGCALCGPMNYLSNVEVGAQQGAEGCVFTG